MLGLEVMRHRLSREWPYAIRGGPRTTRGFPPTRAATAQACPKRTSGTSAVREGLERPRADTDDGQLSFDPVPYLVAGIFH